MTATNPAPQDKGNTVKTAGANAENNMGGSQLETGLDRGDYSGAKEETNKQKKETQDSAAAGTPEAGTQLDSVRFDDQSHSHSGGGGGARVAQVVQTVAALAGVDPKAAASFIRMAEGGDIGMPMGGEPDAVGEGEDALDADPDMGGGAPAPDAGMTAPTPEDASRVKLHDIIQDQEQAIEIDRAVNDKLKEVAKEVGASIHLPYLGMGRVAAWHRDGVSIQFKHIANKVVRFKTAEAPSPIPVDKKGAPGTTNVANPDAEPDDSASKPDAATDKLARRARVGMKLKHRTLGVGTIVKVSKVAVQVKFADGSVLQTPRTALERSDEGGTTPSDEMGNNRVPHAATDPSDHPPGDGDPDWTLYDQSKTSENTSETDTSDGQDLSDSGDRDYVLANKRIVQAQNLLRQRGQKMLAAGKTRKQITAALAASTLGKETFAAVKEMRKLQAAACPCGKKDCDCTAADKKKMKEKEKKKKEKESRRRRQRRAADVGGNTPPDKMDASQADDTTRYDASEQGDTGDDEISQGTNTTLDSPETDTTVSQGRSELDRKHKDDTAGSTVAAIGPKMKAKVLAELKSIDQAHDGLKKRYAAVMPKIALHKSKGAVKNAVQQLVTSLKFHGNAIEACLKDKNTPRAAIRTKLASHVQAGRTLVASAKHQAAFMTVLTGEADNHHQRMARVQPSFVLAGRQLQAGVINLQDLPGKVAEYVALDPASFTVVAKTVNEMIAKTAGRRPPGRQRTASSIPVQYSSGPATPQSVDELDGMFDDDNT